ncbi:MAG TPA: quinol:cytochrome C oxidoreductase [Planctomycetota bacterium]|nr:quinol:cytochrome C oxidoreductase [Planctomycetota bacterium]
MAHGKSHAITERQTALPASLAALSPKALLLGLVLVGAGFGAATAGGGGLEHFLFSYLTAYTFALSIALGGLIFLLLQHVTAAAWSVAVRRMAENVVGTLPWLALLFVPLVVLIAIGKGSLVWMWLDPAWVAENKLALPAKAVVYDAYLNRPFFLVRIAIYFAIWIGLARFFVGNSVAQDKDGDPGRSLRMRKLSAPSILLFALSLTFFGFDVLMSLDPQWFSTIFGVYLFAGCMLAFLTFVTLLTMLVQRRGGLEGLVTDEHYHDLGKLTFAFVFFWGYIAFSQYMLIWYANIPEETIWFKHRQEGDWAVFSFVLLFGHLLLPFGGLLSRWVKRSRPALAFWAVWLLGMHFVDLFWIVMPTYAQKVGDGHHVHLGATDLLVWLGFVALLVGLTLRTAKGRPILALRDPRLPEALAFHNI